MAIITITRQLGSLGTEVAGKLRDQLGINYLDRALLETELVKKCQLPEKDIEKYDEKKPAFWSSFSADKDRYLDCMKTVMYEFAHHGHCVIIGRGGQALFRNIAGAMHIKITAPMSLRVQRAKARFNYDDHLAQQAIQHSDHDRAGFHKYFFQIDWEDASLYHLMLSTDMFDVDTAATLIEDAMSSSGILNEPPEQNSALTELCLTQQIITRIKYIEKIPTEFLTVSISGSAVILRGASVTEEHIKRCDTAVLHIPGVEKVINEMRCVHNPYSHYDRKVEPLS